MTRCPLLILSPSNPHDPLPSSYPQPLLSLIAIASLTAPFLFRLFPARHLLPAFRFPVASPSYMLPCQPFTHLPVALGHCPFHSLIALFPHPLPHHPSPMHLFPLTFSLTRCPPPHLLLHHSLPLRPLTASLSLVASLLFATAHLRFDIFGGR